MADRLIPTEKDECIKLVQYLRIKGHKHSAIMHETGTGRNAKMMGVRNKQMGLTPGVPDYILIVNDNLIWIEMKRQKGGRLSEYQKGWIEALEQAGQTIRVCNGADEAIKFIQTIERD